MKRKLVCVVDYGTSNTRVNAIDVSNGSIAYSASRKYLVDDKGKGYAVISSNEIWSFSEACMGEVYAKLTEEDEVIAISYSFFGDNLIPVDVNGEALDDCILCTDPRGVEEADYINSQIPAKDQRDSIGDCYMPYKFGAKALWVKKHAPYAANVACYDSQQQYVFRKLGLPPVNDYTMAARKQLLELESGTWDQRFLNVLGITPEQLGLWIVPTGDIVGYITSYGNVDLGKKLPVIAGGHDCDVAMIGMGLIDENVDAVGDITGTFDHVGYLADRPVNLKKNDETTPLVSYNGPFPGSSVCLGAFPTAGATLEWFMREMNEGTSGADYNKYWSRVQFDGKGSVMVMPTLDGGRGRIDGISVTTTKADLFKAVIEALTFENRRLIEDCARVKRGQVKRVRIGGGAANSDEWMQLRADISGVTVERMKNIQISSLGGAILAAVAVGEYPDLQAAVDCMVHIGDVFTPNEEVRKKYEEKYRLYNKRRAEAEKGLF